MPVTTDDGNLLRIDRETHLEPRSILSFPYSEMMQAEVESNVAMALHEDLGSQLLNGDLSASLINADHTATATVVSREVGVLCGQAWFAECFCSLDPNIQIVWQVEEGAEIGPDQVLCRLSGRSRVLLSAERSALNFLQMLSAVASKTQRFVQLISDLDVQVFDTRKTLPGLRVAQKYAVYIGGGNNHRMALWDAILIKENHLSSAGGILAALNAADKVAKNQPQCQFVQIEVENLEEVAAALDAGANMLLLDNFNLDMMRQAVVLNKGRASLEASGCIDASNIRAVAQTGIDRISMGALTKDIKTMDLSMRLDAG